MIRTSERTAVSQTPPSVYGSPSPKHISDRRDASSLSAAVSDLNIEFLEGIEGESIPEVALPPNVAENSIKLSKGIRGSWRSHMDALQT